MRGGIFYGEAFGNRGGVEFSISRNQRHCFKPHRLTPPIHFKNSGKLDGIIGTKAVSAGNQHGRRHERRRQFQNIVTLLQMAAAMAKNRCGLRR